MPCHCNKRLDDELNLWFGPVVTRADVFPHEERTRVAIEFDDFCNEGVDANIHLFLHELDRGSRTFGRFGVMATTRLSGTVCTG